MIFDLFFLVFLLPLAGFVTLSFAPDCFAQAPMTKASLTAVQAISSTPFAFSSDALSTKPGRCFAEQVGVNAPGTEKSATLRPLKNSLPSTGSGPSAVARTNCASGTLSPTLIVIVLSSSFTPPRVCCP